MKNYKDINKFKASVLDSVKEELSKLSPIKRWLIEQVIFKNRKIGYRKSEILALKSELEAEQKAKKAKEKPYKQNKEVNKKPRLSNMEKMY